MRKRCMLILLLPIGIIFSSVQSTMAVFQHESKPPNFEDTKGKDSIEWVEMWDEPTTREEKLERMLTTELQRRALFSLQEKQFLKPGKAHLYSFDPFKVTNFRTVNGGLYEIDVLVSVHRVLDNKIDKKAEKYCITFRHNYDLGFVVTGCRKIHEKLIYGE